MTDEIKVGDIVRVKNYQGKVVYTNDGSLALVDFGINLPFTTSYMHLGFTDPHYFHFEMRDMSLVSSDNDFKVGDIVRFTMPNGLIHDHATIVRIVDCANVLLNLHDEYDLLHSKTHNSDGQYENNHYWFVKKEQIKKINRSGKVVSESPKKAKKYEAGQDINEHVAELIEYSKDKERLKWLKTFQNCVLPKHVKESINEALTVILCKDKFDDWGINDHFEKGLTNSLLLWGPAGTGKSMIAECFAAVLDKNLMKIDSGLLQSNVPGQTERNIKEAFETAKNKNCVLMFDECDSVLSNRDMVGTIMSAEINCLLTELENFDGVVVLTTNRLHRLDPALSRRIIAKVELSLPPKETRLEIWQKLLPPKMPIAEGIDWDRLADPEISGGYIKNAILIAARKAISSASAHVTQEHLDSALEAVVSSKDDFEQQADKRINTDLYVEGCSTTGKSLSKVTDVIKAKIRSTTLKKTTKASYANGAV